MRSWILRNEPRLYVLLILLIMVLLVVSCGSDDAGTGVDLGDKVVLECYARQ